VCVGWNGYGGHYCGDGGTLWDDFSRTYPKIAAKEMRALIQKRGSVAVEAGEVTDSHAPDDGHEHGEGTDEGTDSRCDCDRDRDRHVWGLNYIARHENGEYVGSNDC